jgi:hypothetical protein
MLMVSLPSLSWTNRQGRFSIGEWYSGIGA